MNELTLHRSSYPGLNVIDIFVDGQHLTEAVVGRYHPFNAILSHYDPERLMDSLYRHRPVPRPTLCPRGVPFFIRQCKQSS
jgi:hypothetical protein